MIRFQILALLVLASCNCASVPKGGIAVTFEPDSASEADAIVCVRTAPAELACITLEAFIERVNQRRDAEQRPTVEL